MNFPFSKELVLENERAILQPLGEHDFEHLLPVALSDDKLVQYSPQPIHSHQLLSDYIKAALVAKKRSERYPFTIFDKQMNAYAGSTSFLCISDYNRVLDIGATWIGRDFQKTGLNRNCKFLMLQWAFEELNFMRVGFKTDERNTASRTAIEKIGGKFEGILRSDTVMYDGFRRNTVSYSILKNEWEILKQNFL